MPRFWCWIRGLRSRLWLGIEGWVNRWSAGGSHSSASSVRLCVGGCASSTTRALVITALDMATATRGAFPAGVVLHADRGTQCTSQKLAAYMRAVKGTVSMGQAAVCWDNAMAQSLWATLTTKYYYRRAFITRDQVYTGVATWIEDFYNPRRIHTSPGRQIPHRI